MRYCICGTYPQAVNIYRFDNTIKPDTFAFLSFDNTSLTRLIPATL